MAKRRGLLVRALAGRLDQTILSDVGVVAGVVVFGYGLWQMSQPIAWLFAGAALVGLSVIAALPAKKATRLPKGQP